PLFAISLSVRFLPCLQMLFRPLQCTWRRLSGRLQQRHFFSRIDRSSACFDQQRVQSMLPGPCAAASLARAACLGSQQHPAASQQPIYPNLSNVFRILHSLQI
ncbi:hypothetical protein BJ741DRAFT_639497, partial [Chytriomyces cf. hyalinus JEL632]